MLVKENIQNIYPLSPMQEGMFFHFQYNPASTAYFEQASYRVSGDWHIPLIKRSVNELFKRHDILRTVFVPKAADRLLQVVLKQREADFYFEDISARTDREGYLKNYKEKDREKGFDLTADVLMRLGVLQVDTQEYEFIWSHHHILMDGWCVGVLISEFFAIYRSLMENKPYRLPPVVPYRKYIEWLGKQDKRESKRYWATYLDGYEELATIPGLKTVRTGEVEYRLEQLTLSIEPAETVRLQELAGLNTVTLNTLLEAAWGGVLARYNDRRDVVFGRVVSGRPPEIPGVESMVGLFINTLPVRIRYQENTGFRELLRTVQRQAVEGEPYQYESLADIQMATPLKQNLLDHIIAFQNFPVARQIGGLGDEDVNSGNQPGLRVRKVEVFEQTNYDFGIMITAGERLSVRFDYNAAVYERSLVERTAGHLKRALHQIVEDIERDVDAFDLLSEDERQQILFGFNDTRREIGRDKTMVGLFEGQVEETPGYTAIVFTGRSADGSPQLTYGELNKRAGQLARVLMAAGVKPDTVVGMMAARSLEMAVGILAILKAGGAYLPVEPGYPPQRIRFMLEDSGVEILLGDGQAMDGSHRFMNILDEAIYRGESGPIDPVATPLHAAYLIYTSGTTGRPKGVVVGHGGAANTLLYRKQAYRLNERDVTLQLFSYSFDGFVTSFFTPLISGARLVIMGSDEAGDVTSITETIVRNRVSHFICVPPLYRAIIDNLSQREAHSLSVVTLAGDHVSARILELTGEKNRRLKLVNEYGVTECSVLSTIYHHQERDPHIKIGRPIWNTKGYVLDRQGEVQGIGVPGELCISGVGLSRGYLNNPELTAEKFGENPCRKGERLYRTGDLARWLADGALELLGRIDHQVKIRGFRIECGEIENRLVRHPDIKEAVVLVKDGERDGRYLAAFVVTVNFLDAVKLREYLSKELPDYMIPSYFVPLGQIPLTANGKIDRRALLMLKPDANVEWAAPADQLEKRLIDLWSEVLGLEKSRIGRYTNFFEVGGHSLKATVLGARIYKEMAVRLPIATFFQTPTIEGLARIIRRSKKHGDDSLKPVEEREYYALSPAQKRLYVIQQLEPGNMSYNISRIFLLNKEPDGRKLQEVVAQLINRHESLRTSFTIVYDEPVQRVQRGLDFEIDYLTDATDPADDLFRNFVQPFDLSRAPLLRVGLIETDKGEHFLMVDIHHIITDGFSMNLLFQEFDRLSRGGKLPRLALSYKDYSDWQNSRQQQVQFMKRESYWSGEFSGEIPVLNLPLDYRRPAVKNSAGGDSIEFEIEPAAADALRGLARSENATLFMVMLTVFNILLAKLSGQEDIVIGTPVSGRQYDELEGIVGMFVDTLALRNYPVGSKRFVAFLKELRERTLAAFENQEYPLQDLVEKVLKKRDVSRNPLFDVMLSFAVEDSPPPPRKTAGMGEPELIFQPHGAVSDQAIYDLVLGVLDTGDRLMLEMAYSTRLFKRKTIERVVGYFKEIVSLILTDRLVELKNIKISGDLGALKADIYQSMESHFEF